MTHGPTIVKATPVKSIIGVSQQGHQGAQGPQGPQGAGSVPGSQGAQGTQGTAGSQGFQGAAGATGADGPQGFQGAAGAAGSQGAQGPQGAAGSQGSQGAQGAQGSQGSQGSQGTQGNQGYQGTAGPSYTILDAKGDIIVGSAADTAARLAVGTDEQLLVANSTATNGVEWAGFAGVLRPAIPAVNDYLTTSQLQVPQNVTASGFSQESRIVFGMIVVPIAMTFDLITCYVTSAVGAGGLVRMGIYKMDSTTRKPGTLVLDAGTAAAETAGEKTISINQTLQPGIYYLAVAGQGTTGVRTRMITHTGFVGMPVVPATSPSTQTTTTILMFADGYSGALPDPPTTTVQYSGGNIFPMMGIRRSA